MSERRTSSEIEAEIQSVREEVSKLNIDIMKTESKLQEMKTRLRDLEGGFRDSGKVGELKMELVQAKQYGDDSRKITVVWVQDGIHDCVIDKVTKATIYARERGQIDDEWRMCVHKFDLSGNPARQWRTGPIDIRRTFGIDADSVPPNWKPETKESK